MTEQTLSPVPVGQFKFGDPGIILIRGTNGSGKSTMIKKMLTPNAKLLKFDDLGCQYYDCGTHFIVGRYETACGGLDAVRGDEFLGAYDTGQEAIRRLSKIKTTLAEGILASSTFQGSYNTIVAAQVPAFWLSIHIPIEEVFDSILIRRLENGNAEPLVTRNVTAKYRSVIASSNSATEAGVYTFIGSRQEVATAIENIVAGNISALPKSRLFDIDPVNAIRREWDAKNEVKPTQAQIDKYLPKPTTTSLMGFFGT